MNRANLLSLVDNREYYTTESMKGVAKPAYEKVLEVMLANNDGGKHDKNIIIAYNFLGSYYAVLYGKTKKAEDKDDAGRYFQKILEIDSGNAQAQQMLKSLKIKY
ncbi:hypothetical protein AGMMS49965_19620 [Bacteroidia bacterium]|nr:hypothetical protein AGMMS49965_19620 [Bacteroidia bacterium]